MKVVLSHLGIPIRIPKERWDHVILGHPEMLEYELEMIETLSQPDLIFQGNNEEKIAVKDYLGNLGKFIVVVYKETSDKDGFLITSFLTSKLNRLEKRVLLWKK
jgi:hypothetical protein